MKKQRIIAFRFAFWLAENCEFRNDGMSYYLKNDSTFYNQKELWNLFLNSLDAETL